MTDKTFKIYKLRDLKTDQLAKQLDVFRQELFELRSKRVTGATAKKLGRIKVSAPPPSNSQGRQEGYREMPHGDQLQRARRVQKVLPRKEVGPVRPQRQED